MDSIKTVVNNILRCNFTSSNSINVPGLTSNQNEIDHFIEVNHFTSSFLDLLKAKHEHPYEISFGYLFDLATFVNEHRNLFKISKQLNQSKKYVPLNEYSTNSEILKYWNSVSNEGTTVGADVISLVNDMVERKGNYSFYTNKVGEYFLANLIEPMLKVNPQVTLPFPGLKSINHAIMENLVDTNVIRTKRSLKSADLTSLDDVLSKIADKKVASTVSVVAVPPDISQQTLNDLADLKTITQFIYLTGINYLNTHNPSVLNVDLSVPNSVFNFRKELANSEFLVITRGLTGILGLVESSGYDYSKTSKTAEFRLEFIKDLFKDFVFPESTLKQLTSVLNNTLDELKDIKIEFSDLHEKLNMCVLFHYFDDEMGLPGVKIPKTRLFYLQIQEDSWRASLVCGTLEKINFTMSYQDFKYSLYSEQMNNLRANIQEYMNKLSGSQLENIKKLSPIAITTDK